MVVGGGDMAACYSGGSDGIKIKEVDSNMVFDYPTANEEMDMDKDEDIAMLLMMHKNKRPKHGGSVMGREYIRRQRAEAHAKLRANYFVERPVFPERYFRSRFWMSSDLFKHILFDVVAFDEQFHVVCSFVCYLMDHLMN
ncbi:hypothetical protein D1007_39771 [Hordeum vulgare]|nr:hypothetical protein D1007_39771 [Hordeum vulgare]